MRGLWYTGGFIWIPGFGFIPIGFIPFTAFQIFDWAF